MAEREQLERAIEAQEKLRGALPDDVVEVAIRALRDQLALIGDGEERRRQVTVLFADVSGFTTLSERRDPELVTEVMNALWARVDALIVDGGGVVDKHIGDAVMAVWGGSGSREDDPERAVRTGLALQEALLAFRAESDLEIEMRVGVNTGPVLIGSVGTTGEVTVIGDAVNVASRLETAAPLGGVLISHFTYRHIRGVFDVVPREPMLVKGRSDPLRTYVVRRTKPRAFRIVTRGVEGVETQMIGRDAELGALCHAFEEVQGNRQSRMVTVLGDAGVGKSRLLYEFENWVELRPENVYLFKGRALSNRVSVPYGLYRDVIAARFGVLDSDSVVTVAKKLRDGMSSALGPDEIDLVGHWLGFDLGSSAAVQRMAGAAEFATVARAHFVEYLRAFADSETVALLLEDLHWADEESLDLTEYLAGFALSDVPLLIVAVARPLVDQRRSEWSIHGSRLYLHALSNDATRELVREVLQRVSDIPDVLVELMVERSDGNAFYVEELVSMLIDEDIIQSVGEGSWHVDVARLDATRVPPTLTALLQARLDGLAGAERRVVQRASVIGRVFWDAAVAALGVNRGDGATADEVRETLEAARRREFVFQRETSAFDATEEYIFKHALLRDVAYETVLLREREQLHREVAQWLEITGAARKSEYLEMIADHYEHANDIDRAIECLQAGATSARTKGNAAAVRRSLERALTLANNAGQTVSPEMLTTLGEARFRLGDIDAAESALTEVFERVTTPFVRAEALYWMSRVAETHADPEGERAALEQARKLVEDNPGGPLAKVLTGLASWETQYGELDAARSLAHRALSVAESDGDKAEAHRALSMIATLTPDLDLADKHLRATFDLVAQFGNLETEARTIGNRGVIAHLRGDAGEGEEHYRTAAADYSAALALTRRLGLRALESMNTLNIAQVSVRLNDHGAAQKYIRDAAAAAVEMGAMDHLLFCIVIEADRLASLGEVTEALGLIGLARSHPSAGAMLNQETDRVLARISLDEYAIEAGISAGRQLDFNAVIEAILDESNTS